MAFKFNSIFKTASHYTSNTRERNIEKGEKDEEKEREREREREKYRCIVKGKRFRKGNVYYTGY